MAHRAGDGRMRMKPADNAALRDARRIPTTRTTQGAVKARTERRPAPRARRDGGGHHYYPDYLSTTDRRSLLEWLETIHPIWENRYPTDRPLPAGREQRRLLRPVYWLGSWQFACLDYYRPPRGIHDRCVAAEPFPAVLAKLVHDVQERVRRLFPASQVPRGWTLNTCLINFYGSREEGGRWVDSARVGEHRDFEPGPVASLSIGERALFQFVAMGVDPRTAPLFSQWLDDNSLQIFGGPRLKDQALHRVQRVDRRTGIELPPAIDGFRTRRINFTFRFVPPEHVVQLNQLSEPARSSVVGYVEELAARSQFFRDALAVNGKRRAR